MSATQRRPFTRCATGDTLEPFRAVGGYFTVIVPFISDEWKSQR